MTSTNPVVQKALNARAARNSGARLRVALETATFKGRNTQSQVMTTDQLEQFMKSVGLGGDYKHIMREVEDGSWTDFTIECRCKVQPA